MEASNLATILKAVQQCQICALALPYPPRPVLALSEKTQILIIGQAPGQRVQNSGIPWSDKSGDNLRNWLGVTAEQFANTDLFGTMPMGFCYPGSHPKGTGDAPPRPECAPQWHQQILDELPNLKLVLVVGQYAINSYLKKTKKRNLTETVRAFETYLPHHFPIVHPSPLNYRWHARNPWFKTDVLPVLKAEVQAIIR